MKKQLLTALFTLVLMLASLMGMGQTAYITNSNDNTVSVINVATNTVIDNIKVGAYPQGVCTSPDGTKVYIMNGGDSTVSVINTANNTVSATIRVNDRFLLNYSDSFLAISPDGNKVYVTSSFCPTVNVINTLNDSVSSFLGGAAPESICVSPDGSKVYFVDNLGNSVTVINTANNTYLTSIPVDSFPVGLAISPDGSTVYVAVGDSVSVINTTTNTVSATIAVGINPLCICVSPDGSRIYVTNYWGVSVINTAINTVIKTVKVGINGWAIGISISPDGSKLYVANANDNTVSVINTATNMVTDVIKVGAWPIADGNFISSYTAPCASYFLITADTAQLHHYIVTNNAFGKGPIKYVWSWGDGTSDSIPYPSHTYADSGFYNICLSITDSLGCQSTYCDSSFHAMRTTNTMVYVEVVNPLTTGTQTINAQVPQVILYPNPATNQLTIITSCPVKEATVSIMNVLGQAVLPSSISHLPTSINISSLLAGIYFLQMKWEGGSAVKKFVKE